MSRLNSALVFRWSYSLNSLVFALKSQISDSACFCAGMFKSYLVKNQIDSRYGAKMVFRKLQCSKLNGFEYIIKSEL